jgi:hypothetical protein
MDITSITDIPNLGPAIKAGSLPVSDIIEVLNVKSPFSLPDI